MTKPDSPKSEVLRLNALKAYHILDTLPEQSYDDIAAIAAQICDSPIALISLIDDKRQWIKAKSGIPDGITELPKELSCCAHTVQNNGEIFEIPDADQDERFLENPLCINEPYIKFYTGAPLITNEGHIIGTICVIDHKPKTLSLAQKNTLEALARQVMALLELRKESHDFVENKSKLQRLVETISDVIYELDEVGKFIYVNPALIKLSEYTEQELLQKAYYDLVHPNYMDKLGQFYYEQIKNNSDDSYYEFPMLTKSGKTVWLGQTVKIFFQGDRVTRVGAFAKNITELRKVRHDLKESEALYRLLSENSGSLVCLQTPKGVFTYASPSVKELTGYTPEEFINTTHSELVHPQDLPVINEEFRKVLAGEENTQEYRIRKSTGEHIWVETIAKPVINEAGEVTSVQTSTKDISRRKDDEFRRKRERANLQALIENSNDIIWSVDRSFRYITFNGIFRDIVTKELGQGPEVGNLAILNNLPEKFRDYWLGLYNRAFSGERFIEEMYGINDKHSFFECSFNPIIDDFKDVIGVSVFAREITERVKQRERRDHFQQALALLNDLSANTELEYGDLIAKGIEEVCNYFDMDMAMLCEIKDDRYRVEHAYSRIKIPQPPPDSGDLKDTFCELTYQKGEVIAINKASDSPYKEHRCHIINQIEAYIGTPIVVGPEKFGTLSLSSAQVRPLPFDNYDEEFFELFGRWVSALMERKRYEQLIWESKEKAESASKAKEHFLSAMSHEIRTPLNAIIGMTHILLQENPKPSQLDNLNTLKFSGENLLVLLNDVLDINKIESGKLFLDQSDFNLKELLDSIKNALSYSFKEKDIECAVNYDSELPRIVMGDSMRIAQVLNNLLSNAIKFTDRGAITVDVENRGISDDTVCIHFAVSDTGIGMSEEEQKKIFERFTQAKTTTARDYGGSGLGLSIIKGLLELMGSEIHLKSTPGKGSKFSFELELPLSERNGSEPGSIGMPNLEKVSIKNVSVLLVEDNKVNQVVSTKFLHNWGITVSLANNGEEAIALFKERRFDIILMDLQMPVMDGYKATKLIREMDTNIPILALTASVRIGQRNRAMKAGMNDFLIKPLTPHDLYLKLSKFIAKDRIGEITQPEVVQHNKATQEFQTLKELLQGDDDFKNEVVPLYISNIKTIRSRLPINIVNRDGEAADRLRHKMQTTLHTLEASNIRALIDEGIDMIDEVGSDKELKGFASKLERACKDIEQRLEDFLG